MGVATGFKDLDNILDGGLQKGCLYVLAGRPSMGKTGMAISMIDHICLKNYRTAAYFSLEVSRRQIVDRILALKAEIKPYKLRTGEIDGEDWRRIAKAAETIADAKLIVDDTSSIDVESIRSKCNEIRKDNKDLDVIFVDYLQLMSESDTYGSREGELSKIVTSLKELAVELDRPIVVLSQLSRVVEYREDRRPILSDLKDSESLVHLADVIMFLYRDEYYNRDSERKGIAEVIVAKNSMGSVGTIELGFDPRFVEFENKR